MNGWTDGEDKWMAIARGEMPYDRREEEPEEEEREPEREDDPVEAPQLRILVCGDCRVELYRGTGEPPLAVLYHTCAAQARANRVARRRGAA